MTPRTKWAMLVLLLIAVPTLAVSFRGPLLAGLTLLSGGGTLSASKSSANRPVPLALDEDVTAAIRRYAAGVSVEPQENTLQHAIQLDHAVGRPAVSEGRYRDAHDTYRKVLAISLNQGSLMGVGIGLLQLSAVFQKMNDRDGAIRTAMLAYQVGKAMGQRFEYGVTEMNLARLLRPVERELGMMWMLRAKDSLDGTPHKQDYVHLLRELGTDLRYLDRDREGTAILAQAWEEALQLGQSPDHKWARREVALAYARALRAEGECETALTISQTSEAGFAKSERETEMYYPVLHEIALCRRKLGETALAEQGFRRAYAYYELARAKALGDQARAKQDRAATRLVNAFVDHYLADGKPLEALALLESNKARTLEDIRWNAEQKDGYARLSTLRKQQAAARVEMMERLAARQREYRDADWSQAVIDLVQLYKQQEDEQAATRTALNLRRLPVAAALTPERLTTLQTRLADDAVLLAVYVGSKQAGVFTVTRDALAYHPARLSSAQLNRRVQELRLALGDPYTDFYREPARHLYRDLLAPALASIKRESATLLYSPDGLLAHVPLGALMDGDTFLAERHAVVQLPSLRYYAPQLHSRAASLAHGISCVDPKIDGARLPFQSETGELLSELYGEDLTDLKAASCAPGPLADAIAALALPGFLHIGAHGSFDSADPMGSGIQLSDDQGQGSGALWDARAIAATDLSRIGLATLSSCETGSRDLSTPRDVFGMPRALFFAGIKTVLAPLWRVHDRASAHLMQAFYRRYRTGVPSHEALRQARRAMLDSPDYAHPYYWAGFVMEGAAS